MMESILTRMTTPTQNLTVVGVLNDVGLSLVGHSLRAAPPAAPARPHTHGHAGCTSTYVIIKFVNRLRRTVCNGPTLLVLSRYLLQNYTSCSHQEFTCLGVLSTRDLRESVLAYFPRFMGLILQTHGGISSSVGALQAYKTFAAIIDFFQFLQLMTPEVQAFSSLILNISKSLSKSSGQDPTS